MAVCLMFDAPGGTSDQYDQVRNEVAPGELPPPGALYHVDGPTEGGWYMVEVWDSHKALDSFVTEVLRPALERAGLSGEPRVLDVASVMQL